MRKAIILTLLSVLALFACTDRRYPTTLVVADSLCAVNPDSALHLLTQYKDSIQTASKADRMYYELLTVKASDKADLLQPDADHILSLVDYYEHGGDKSLLPTAYYYAGRTYCELRDEPTALHYYLLGENKCDETDPLISRIYSQIAYSYYHRDIISRSLDYHRKSLRASSIQRDTISMIYAMRDIATIYLYEKKLDSCIMVSQQALLFAHLINDAKRQCDLEAQIASCHYEMGRIEQARSEILSVLPHVHSASKIGIYTIASKIFLGNNELDSCSYYLHEIIENGSLFAKKTAHKRMADVYMRENRFSLAQKELAIYEQLDDSIQLITESETLAKAHAIYNYQMKETERHELELNSQRKSYFLIIAVILFSAIIFMLLVQYRNYQKQQEEKIKRYIDLQESKNRFSIEQNDKNKKEIADLERRIESLSSENRELRESLILKKKELENQTSLSTIISADRENKFHQLERTQSYKLIRYMVNAPSKALQMNDERWLMLERDVNSIYKDFTETVLGTCKMKEQAFHICLLIKLHLTTADISKILSCEKQIISNTKRRLFERCFGKTGGAKEWDEYILSI